MSEIFSDIDCVGGLCAATSRDGMTNNIYDLTARYLGRLAMWIVSEVFNIGRTVYGIGSKHASPVEWE